MLTNQPSENYHPENIEPGNIARSLTDQLHKMDARRPGRQDIKYQILKKFVDNLDTKSFSELYHELSPIHKHAIITRLENEAKHMGGKVPFDFISNLEHELYGVEIDEDGDEMINFAKKVELEQNLQAENNTKK